MLIQKDRKLLQQVVSWCVRASPCVCACSWISFLFPLKALFTSDRKHVCLVPYVPAYCQMACHVLLPSSSLKQNDPVPLGSGEFAARLTEIAAPSRGRRQAGPVSEAQGYLCESSTTSSIYYFASCPRGCNVRSNKTPAFQISWPRVQIWDKPETWPGASPLHQPSHLCLLVVISCVGRAVFNSGDDWSVAVGNLKQIQGPVWHLPVNVYVTGLTGVPFFSKLFKGLSC